MLRKTLILLVIVFVALCFYDCSGCSGGNKSVTVSWTANREVAVNTTGGGYIVYYSTTRGFDTDSASNVTVSYESGSQAPTSATLNLSGETWYIKVVAFASALTGSTVYSPASEEYKLEI